MDIPLRTQQNNKYSVKYYLSVKCIIPVKIIKKKVLRRDKGIIDKIVFINIHAY